MKAVTTYYIFAGLRILFEPSTKTAIVNEAGVPPAFMEAIEAGLLKVPFDSHIMIIQICNTYNNENISSEYFYYAAKHAVQKYLKLISRVSQLEEFYGKVNNYLC